MFTNWQTNERFQMQIETESEYLKTNLFDVLSLSEPFKNNINYQVPMYSVIEFFTFNYCYYHPHDIPSSAPFSYVVPGVIKRPFCVQIWW